MSPIVDTEGGWKAFCEHVARAPIAAETAPGSWHEWYDRARSLPARHRRQAERPRHPETASDRRRGHRRERLLVPLVPRRRQPDQFPDRRIAGRTDGSYRSYDCAHDTDGEYVDLTLPRPRRTPLPERRGHRPSSSRSPVAPPPPRPGPPTPTARASRAVTSTGDGHADRRRARTVGDAATGAPLGVDPTTTADLARGTTPTATGRRGSPAVGQRWSVPRTSPRSAPTASSTVTAASPRSVRRFRAARRDRPGAHPERTRRRRRRQGLHRAAQTPALTPGTGTNSRKPPVCRA